MSDSYYDPPEYPEPEGSVSITITRPVEQWPYEVPPGTVEVEAEVDVDLPDADATVTEWRAYGETQREPLASAKRCKGLALTLELVEVEEATEALVAAAEDDYDAAYERAKERRYGL